jgi:hypothetical protein
LATRLSESLRVVPQTETKKSVRQSNRPILRCYAKGLQGVSRKSEGSLLTPHRVSTDSTGSSTPFHGGCTFSSTCPGAGLAHDFISRTSSLCLHTHDEKCFMRWEIRQQQGLLPTTLSPRRGRVVQMLMRTLPSWTGSVTLQEIPCCAEVSRFKILPWHAMPICSLLRRQGLLPTTLSPLRGKVVQMRMMTQLSWDSAGDSLPRQSLAFQDFALACHASCAPARWPITYCPSLSGGRGACSLSCFLRACAFTIHTTLLPLRMRRRICNSTML